MRAALAVLIVGCAALGCTVINGFDEVVIREEPDPPPMCMAEPCKLTAPQCGCPEGQMCEYVSGTVECVTEADAALGEACMPYGCGPGLHCVRFFDEPSICHPWCDTDEDCAGIGQCVVTLADGFTQKLCSYSCDPITSGGCGLTGTKCALLVSQATQQGYTACGAVGAGTSGAICMDTGDCAAGHHCVLEDVVEVCRPYCLVQTPQCPMGQECRNFDPTIIVGGVIYGVCIDVAAG